MGGHTFQGSGNASPLPGQPRAGPEGVVNSPPGLVLCRGLLGPALPPLWGQLPLQATVIKS